MKYCNIGGQAVLEGVMMRSPERMALAVRRSDGEIELQELPMAAPAPKGSPLRWPIVRGVVNFVQMLFMGVRTISLSAELIGEETEPPSPFEEKLAKLLGKKAEEVMMSVAVVVALALGIGLFFVLPSVLTSLLAGVMQRGFLLNLLEGVLRLGIFLGYLLLISRMKEIQRVFMYHGAEHKTIACYEHEEALTPENAMRFTRLHPRCGTSFLLIVMVISVVVFSVVSAFGIGTGWFMRVVTRLLLLPFVAGISYEVLKLLARFENGFTRALRWPGLQLQRLTTKEPTADMLEVAIASFNFVLGKPWRAETDVRAETDAAQAESTAVTDEAEAPTSAVFLGMEEPQA